MSELAVICPACTAALAAWERGGHHLSCRACEVRAAAGGSIAARAAFYAGLLQVVERTQSPPELDVGLGGGAAAIERGTMDFSPSAVPLPRVRFYSRAQ